MLRLSLDLMRYGPVRGLQSAKRSFNHRELTAEAIMLLICVLTVSFHLSLECLELEEQVRTLRREAVSGVLKGNLLCCSNRRRRL